MIYSSLKDCPNFNCTNLNEKFNTTSSNEIFPKKSNEIPLDSFNFKGLQLKKIQNIKKLKPADVLVVLAHPDDEVCFFGFIAKMIKQNKKTVQLVYTTSGENGRDIRNKIPRFSPKMKKVREIELKKSLEKLGLQRDPILLDLGDGKTRTPEVQEIMLPLLQRIVKETKPKEVYSFTPEGITRHPDHISLGEILPDVIHAHKKVSRQKTRLFQVGFTESQRRNIINAVVETSGIGIFVKVIRSIQPLKPKFNIKKNLPTLIKAFKEQTTQFTDDTVKALEFYFKNHPNIYVAEKKIPISPKKNVYNFTEKDIKRIEELIENTKTKKGN